MGPAKTISADQLSVSLLRQLEHKYEDAKPGDKVAALIARGIFLQLQKNGEKPGIFIEVVSDRADSVSIISLLHIEPSLRRPTTCAEALALFAIEEMLLADRSRRLTRRLHSIAPESKDVGPTSSTPYSLAPLGLLRRILGFFGWRSA